MQNIRKPVVRNVVLPTLFPNTLNPNPVPQPRLDDVADCRGEDSSFPPSEQTVFREPPE